MRPADHLFRNLKVIFVFAILLIPHEGNSASNLRVSLKSVPTFPFIKEGPLPSSSGKYDHYGPFLIKEYDRPSINWPSDGETSWNVNMAGMYDTRGFANGVIIAGNLAFVADFDSGLVILDVSDPSAIVELGHINTEDLACKVTLYGDYAYVADRAGGLRIIDVSDPANPQEIGFFDTVAYSLDVAVSGGYAYVADYLDGLRIIDVSDPAAPFEVGYYNRLGSIYSVEVIGNLAYMTDYHQGLRILDVSNPSAPSEIGYYDTDSYALDVSVEDTLAYVADYWDGLRIVDVSDPTQPNEAGFYYTSGNTYGVDVSGSHAYLADYHRGLRVIDITSLSSPFEIGFYNTSSFAMDLEKRGNYVYVADGDDGLLIFEFQPSFVTLTCPGDTTIQAFSTYPKHILNGFKITNSSVYHLSYSYSLSSSGPATLSDEGDPLSLNGNTPVIQPGESYSPPKAALVVPTIRAYSIQSVKYRVAVADHPEIVDSCITTIVFEAPLDVTIEDFSAAFTPKGIRLTWEITGTDGIKGFAILRNGIQVNPALLPGNSRSYLDEEVDEGKLEYTLEAHLDDGSLARSITVSLEKPISLPKLNQNYPNPFNPATNISFELPERSLIQIDIIDIRGRIVRKLAGGSFSSGYHSIIWDGKDDRGTRLSSGIYICRLRSGRTVLSRKMILMK